MVQEELFKIEEGDLNFLKKYLQIQQYPVMLYELARQLTLFKTESDRQKKIKIYNSECTYQVGDLIYKEYSGKLPIGNKKFIELDQGVILRVVELKESGSRQYLRLVYEGVSEFRKHIEYLKRQKIDLLLPHKMGNAPIEILDQQDDPRRQEIPLLEKDLNQLARKLASALTRDKEIALSSGYVFWKEKLTPPEADLVSQIKDFFVNQKKPVTTEFLVEHFLKKNRSDQDFVRSCFLLNYTFENFYKVLFRKTSEKVWGKWFLISELVRRKRDSLIAENNPLLSKVEVRNPDGLAQKMKTLEGQLFPEGENRIYITLREIAAGALRLNHLNLKLGDEIELEVVDTESKKEFLLFYYKDDHLLLGLEPIFELHRAVGGTVAIIEQSEEGKLALNIKQSKKGIVFERIDFNLQSKRFEKTDQQFSSSVMVNKSMVLEGDELQKLNEQLEALRQLPTLNKLVQKIFLEFGEKSKNYELHILKLYHLLDIVFPIDIVTVEKIVLGNSEFVASEKVEGVFYLDSEAVNAIEEEERQRREKVLEEVRRRREAERLKKLEEERKKKEEIRRLREERRRKREEEMWLKEKRNQQKKVSEPEKVPLTKEESFVAVTEISLRMPKKVAAEKFEPQSVAQSVKPEPKKIERKEKEKVEEKGLRPVKKGGTVKRTADELIEIEEIKKEISAQPELESVEKKKEVEKEVVYQDKVDFGGIFAKKLEEAIFKEKKDSKKEPKKESRKK